jgi:hypothetical protein
MPRRPRSEAGITRRLLQVMVNEELLKAIRVTSVYANVRVIDVVEDAFKIYLLLYQGKARLVLEQGTELKLASMSIDKVTTKCGSNQHIEQAIEGTQLVQSKPQEVTIPTNADAPSFIKDNPWLAIIARKG